MRIGITQRYDWLRAQQSLYDSLGNSMRLEIPRGTNDLARIGDVSYMGRDVQMDQTAAIACVKCRS